MRIMVNDLGGVRSVEVKTVAYTKEGLMIVGGVEDKLFRAVLSKEDTKRAIDHSLKPHKQLEVSK